MVPAGFALVESFFRRLEKHFPRDLVVFDDNMIFAQSFFNVASGNRFYPNSGVSSLGHAIPAAIGARFADDKPTLSLSPSSQIGSTTSEAETCSKQHFPAANVSSGSKREFWQQT